MFSKTKFVSTLKCILLCADMEYKVGLIENIYFAYRLYGYIHTWIRIYSRSFRSFRIHGASSPCHAWQKCMQNRQYAICISSGYSSENIQYWLPR